MATRLEAFKALFQNDQLLWVALSYLLYAIANVNDRCDVLPPSCSCLTSLLPFHHRHHPADRRIHRGRRCTPDSQPLDSRRYLPFTGGMVSMIIGYTMLALFSSNLPVVIVALIFFYVPAQFIQMTAILSLTDSIEYGQLKNGRRNEAVTLSVRPMLDKIGGAMSNGAVGAVALAAGMTGHATAADMTASNIATFKTFAFYVPLVLIILSLVVFWFKVKIDEKMHAQIVEELEAKLASGEIVDDEAQAVIKN